MHGLFPQKVKLEPISHKYYDTEGREYLSVSKVLSLLSEPFDRGIAKFSAKKLGITEEEVLASWDKKRDDAAAHGTRMHDALELYSKTGQILVENAEMEAAIKSVLAEYSEYNRCHEEVALYSEKYRVAGTTDKICVLSNRKDSMVDIADYKTNVEKGIEFVSKYNKWFYEPFSHLQDCNYIKYSFQLSIYAWMFENLTGRKVRRMFLHFIPKDNPLQHQIIPVMYMKNDVELLFKTYEPQIMALLDKRSTMEAF